MPELPEVEVSRQGLLPYLPGQRVLRVVARVARLRHEIPVDLAARIAGLRVDGVGRRGKYLLLDCESSGKGGWLLLHFGMSGSVRLVGPETPPSEHDHFDVVFPQTVLRFRDPRRFGAVLWQQGADAERHPALLGLGVEPLSAEFDGDWLYQATRARRAPIKPVLMDNRLLVGVGNIYAAESLFAAGVSPLRAADRISRERYGKIALAIRSTLAAAIAAGGSSVRDYVHSDGGAGCFQLACAVYGRAGENCRQCATPVRVVRQAGRSTYYCPRCQR